MYFSRLELKKQAVELIKNSKPKAVFVTLIYLVLSFVLTELSGKILGINMTMDKLQQYMTHVQNGNIDFALQLLETMSPSAMGYAINLVLQLVLTVVFAGYTIYLLNLTRNNEPCVGNLLDGFGLVGKVILLSVLKTIFVFLWTLLFFIPGIIAMYRYKMALYILLDNPQMSVMQCLKESSKLMKGHKMEFFVLELSFIGWILLGSFGMAGYIIQIWSLPYMNLTYIQFYERIKVLNC